MWRNEQRNLEAEAAVLVEQLRDLVASNATLRAKYVSVEVSGGSATAPVVVEVDVRVLQ